MKEGLTNGVFEKLKFPLRVFKEYPKHLPLKTKDAKGRVQFAVVQNKREEIAMLADGQVDVRRSDPLIDANVVLEQSLNAKNAEIEALKKQLAEARGAKIVAGPTPAKPKAAEPETESKV